MGRLQAEALRLVATVGNALAGDGDLKTICIGAAARLRFLIDSANAIANGHISRDHGEAEGDFYSQLTIDTLFNPGKRWA